MKQRERERKRDTVWKMKNQKYKKEIATHCKKRKNNKLPWTQLIKIKIIRK